MSARCSRWVGCAVVLVLAVAGGPPARAEGDPLPKGAAARYGVSRLGVRAWATPAPPAYSAFLVPDPDGGLRAYDVVTGRPVGEGPPAPKPVAGGGGVVVSADGKRAVAVRPNGLSVRDVATGEAVGEVQVPGVLQTLPGVSTVALSADGSRLAHGGQGPNGRGEVGVWDVAKAELIGRVPVVGQGPLVPHLSPDGTRLAAFPLYTYAPAAGPGRPVPAEALPAVGVYEVATGKELFKARVTQTGSNTAVAFAPDGKTLATAAADGPIDLWEVPSGKLVTTLLGRTGQGARVAFSPDGKELAALATDGTVQRWTLPGGEAVTTEPPADLPPIAPAGVAFAPGGKVVAWGAAGATTVVWEAPTGKLLTPVGEHVGAVRSLAVAAGGKEVVTAGSDSRIVRWDATTGKPLGPVALKWPRLPGPAPVRPGARGPLMLAADGTRALSAASPAGVFDLATGDELFVVPRGPVGRYSTYQFPADDLSKVASLVVPPANDPRGLGTLTVWDLKARKRAVELELPAVLGANPAAAFSPDGTRLVTLTTMRTANGQQNTLITGWDLVAGKRLGELEEPGAFGATAVAVASDTSALIAGGGKVWAVDYAAGRRGDDVGTTEQPRADGNLPGTGVVAVALDGRRFAAGVLADPAAGVYGVRVYDWPTGKPLHTFAGHGGPVTALLFGPDGKSLLSGSADTTAIRWDLSAIPAK